MKQKTVLALVSFFSLLLLCAGCGDMETDANVSLSSVLSESSSASQNVSSQAVSSSERLPENSVSNSDVNPFAPEYFLSTDDPAKKIVLIPAGETLTLSDGKVLKSGMLLPDGRYFPNDELEKHHYYTDWDYILPDGTVLYGRSFVYLAYMSNRLTTKEWEESEAENFSEEERWELTPETKELDAHVSPKKGTWNGLWKPAEEESSLQSGSEN